MGKKDASKRGAPKESLLDQIAEKEAMITKLQNEQKPVEETHEEDEIWEEEEDPTYEPQPVVHPLPTHVYVLGVVVLYAVVTAVRVELINNGHILPTAVAFDAASDLSNPRGKSCQSHASFA
jgi:hypothetical protein